MMLFATAGDLDATKDIAVNKGDKGELMTEMVKPKKFNRDFLTIFL